MDFSIFKNRFSNPCLVLISIIFSVLIIYCNIYNNSFVFDDVPRIVENKIIRDLSNFLSPNKLLQPRAVVDFTFALNYRFGKLNVFGYHLVNVLVHILNGFLVYLLSLAILKQRPEFSNPTNHSVSESTKFSIESISFFSAMIFVAHPIQTQAVTYTVQRYASMAAMFYMASVFFYFKARIIQERAKSIEQGAKSIEQGARSRERGARSRERGARSREQRAKSKEWVEKKEGGETNKLKLSSLYALSIVCGMLAFLSKQNTASLPGAILLAEYLIINGTWHDWKKKLPWFALAFTCWLLFVLYVSGLFSGEFGDRNMLEDVSALTKETVTAGRWSYLCTQFNVLIIYIRLLFLPIYQNLDYLYPFKTGFFDGLTPFAFIILIALTGFGIWSKKRRPVITFSIFYFFITLSVESSIIPIRDALFEHRLYLPMFGFGLFVSYQLFHYLSNKRSLALFLSLSIIVSLGSATYLRNITWQDHTSLWSDVVSKSHHNYRAHYNLGLALKKQGRTEEAIEHYLQALRIKPDFEDAHNNLGTALDKQGRTEEAIEHYLQALQIKPDYVDAHYNLGNALKKRGRTAEAIEHYLQALRIKPDHEEAHNNLAIALFRKGNIEGAIAHFRKALRINPDHIHAKNNLKKVLMIQRQN